MHQLILPIEILLVEQLEQHIVAQDALRSIVGMFRNDGALRATLGNVDVIFSCGELGYINLMRMFVPEQQLLPFPEFIDDVSVISAIR